MAAWGRTTFRFGLTQGNRAASEPQLPALEAFLQRALGVTTELVTVPSYEALVQLVSRGEVEAAWAPPFVCARLEVLGLPILARALRRGQATYRAELLIPASAPVSVEALRGGRAAWTDPDSIAGHLLPIAWFKAQGHRPDVLFAEQRFVGSYRAALEAVLEGTAAVTSVYAANEPMASLDSLWPGHRDAFRVLGTTGESPNDGIVTGANFSWSQREGLLSKLIEMGSDEAGQRLLREVFQADGREAAPPLSYRALYRLWR